MKDQKTKHTHHKEVQVFRPFVNLVLKETYPEINMVRRVAWTLCLNPMKICSGHAENS